MCGIYIQWNTIQPWKGITDTCYDMDELWRHYAKWKKPDTKSHTIWSYLHEISRTGKSIGTE